ncbi:hypothetical protein B0H11DRAFT_1939941 [Mycena galericulata]|nr:hypothetical protein B0H11DRAFT_1939941 [Mycena galericulata]
MPKSYVDCARGPPPPFDSTGAARGARACRRDRRWRRWRGHSGPEGDLSYAPNWNMSGTGDAKDMVPLLAKDALAGEIQEGETAEVIKKSSARRRWVSDPYATTPSASQRRPAAQTVAAHTHFTVLQQEFRRRAWISSRMRPLVSRCALRAPLLLRSPCGAAGDTPLRRRLRAAPMRLAAVMHCRSSLAKPASNDQNRSRAHTADASPPQAWCARLRSENAWKTIHGPHNRKTCRGSELVPNFEKSPTADLIIPCYKDSKSTDPADGPQIVRRLLICG